MATNHKINGDGICTTCGTEPSEKMVQCYDCKEKFHGVCNKQAPFGCSSFITSFNNLKKSNFMFVCDECITKRENHEASSIKDQLADLTQTVKALANEVRALKTEKNRDNVQTETTMAELLWAEQVKKVKTSKASLYVKSKGDPVDLKKMEEIVTQNSIQVTKTTVQENGDVRIDLPSVKHREKLKPLLEENKQTTVDPRR